MRVRLNVGTVDYGALRSHMELLKKLGFKSKPISVGGYWTPEEVRQGLHRGPKEVLDMSRRAEIERAFCGALRSTIDAHGPITAASAPSAAKRMIGALKSLAPVVWRDLSSDARGEGNDSPTGARKPTVLDFTAMSPSPPPGRVVKKTMEGMPPHVLKRRGLE